MYKSQRKTNHGRESLPSSVAPDGTDKGMLYTPAQQGGSFITVIFTCPKGAQSKLMWRFFNDSWDWSIPSVFNTEIASFILRWEPFRIPLCNFLSSERQRPSHYLFPLHLSARLLLGEWHKFKKESLRTLPLYFSHQFETLQNCILILLYMTKCYGTGNRLTKQYKLEIDHLKPKA